MKVLMHHSQRAARSFVRGLEIRLYAMAPTLPRFEQAGIYIDWCIIHYDHRILCKDLPTNFVILPLLKLKIFKSIILFAGIPIDLSPYNQNFDLGKSRQIFHHSLKEHQQISNIPKFRCEML